MPGGLNAVLKAWHVMVGRDLHIPWPPGSPSPAPAPVPYVTTMLMMGVVPLTTRYTTTVYTDGLAPAMVRGTDIGPMIPHVGPPSVTLPMEMLMSGSKSYFGASTVQVKDQWGAPGNLACALLGFTNPNLNCGTPLPTPFGLVIAPTTHMETLSIGDVVAGAYMMAWDFALQGLLNKLGDAAPKWLGEKIAKRLGVGVLGRTVARQMARAMGVRSNIGPTARVLRNQAAARLASVMDRVATAYLPVGFGIGSPLGISISNVRDSQGNQIVPSGSDRVTGVANIEGRGDAMGRSVDDYFNSPAAEEVPPSSPPASAVDAGVPDGDGAAGAADGPDASASADAPDVSSVPAEPNMSTPDASPRTDAPTTSSGPEPTNMSTSDVPSTSEAPPTSSAADEPNMSTPDGDGVPTGSDGTPEAPFSSSDGPGGPGKGQ